MDSNDTLVGQPKPYAGCDFTTVHGRVGEATELGGSCSLAFLTFHIPPAATARTHVVRTRSKFTTVIPTRTTVFAPRPRLTRYGNVWHSVSRGSGTHSPHSHRFISEQDNLWFSHSAMLWPRNNRTPLLESLASHCDSQVGKRLTNRATSGG